MKHWFAHAAKRASSTTGHYLTFTVALTIVVLWAISGPLFGYSDSWQLFINTGTTIVTFLMVFLIQNAQNRDTLALQLKLDELLRAIEAADNRLIGVEDKEDPDAES